MLELLVSGLETVVRDLYSRQDGCTELT